MERFGSKIAALHLLLYCLDLAFMLYTGEAVGTTWMQTDLLWDIQNICLHSEKYLMQFLV